jgi:hypothetical protein
MDEQNSWQVKTLEFGSDRLPNPEPGSNHRKELL